VNTTDKVAFITIDDGWIRRSDALSTLKELHVPVTLFLTINAIKADPGYFRALQGAGAVIEAHTINHVELKGKSYSYQKEQICGSADQLGKWYGRRPIFFRPPFGDKDDTTLRAAHDCGIHACFFWRETVNAGIVRYQIGHSVRPGDILLMHFRDTFSQDLRAAVKAVHDAGLQVALLEDYVS
jgi:peptidoglycan/xylan/chitin deacetylase (PgdA/CDA1 family)